MRYHSQRIFTTSCATICSFSTKRSKPTSWEFCQVICYFVLSIGNLNSFTGASSLGNYYFACQFIFKNSLQYRWKHIIIKYPFSFLSFLCNLFICLHSDYQLLDICRAFYPAAISLNELYNPIIALVSGAGQQPNSLSLIEELHKDNIPSEAASALHALYTESQRDRARGIVAESDEIQFGLCFFHFLLLSSYFSMNSTRSKRNRFLYWFSIKSESRNEHIVHYVAKRDNLFVLQNSRHFLSPIVPYW